jgi:hypothetical protein
MQSLEWLQMLKPFVQVRVILWIVFKGRMKNDPRIARNHTKRGNVLECCMSLG